MRPFLSCLALLTCLCILSCSDNSSDGSSDTDDDIQTPSLREITSEEAEQLVTYLRHVRIKASPDGEEYPMAWAMINTCCEERTMVMEYATASSSFPLPDEPFVMSSDDITDEAIENLADNPGIDIATINITGPMITDVVFQYPDGSQIPGEPAVIYWPYHRSAVVNVEGTLKVIDLSTSTGLMDIDEWAQNLVYGSVECYHMTEEEYTDLKAYWNTMMSGPYEDLERPERIYGYTITPIFTARWDQAPLADQLKWTPSQMETQSGAFKSFMSDSYGITVSDSDEAFYTCIYTPHDEDWLCENADPPYCNGGSGGGGLIPDEYGIREHQ